MGLKSKFATWAIGKGVGDFLKHSTRIDKVNRKKIVEATKHMMKPKGPKREPVLYGGLVSILVAVGGAYGLDLTAEQLGITISTVVAIVTFFLRKRVTPLD
tara:strand:- start:92 stop:394 length:303 start_codon:yes stop_codon:yes gene_type:complete